MTPRAHATFWSFVFIIFLALLFVFKAMLLPFVLALAISYFLEPLMKKLDKTGFGRGVSALIILFVFFIFTLGFFAAILPIAYRESLEFSKDFPSYIDHLWLWLQPLSEQLHTILGYSDAGDLRALLVKNAGTAANISAKLMQQVLAGGQAFANLLSLFFITPLVAYFMMKEWPYITHWIKDLMPQDHKKTILDLLTQIDQKISGFVRGQISVAVILGVTYAIALSLAGLKYGFLIGLLAGLLSIVPMLGSALGLLVSVLIAWFQAGDIMFVFLIAGIFLIGQVIEGNILTPKLVGGSVGLHPLWVFFALMAGGAIFGILGMLLAVPVAAIIGVLLAFAITQYKSSPYYKGKKKAPSKPKKGKKNA